MDVYVVTEIMDYDLHDMCRCICFAEMIDQTRTIMYQMLSGLNHMHKSNVLHRDIKPGNILVNLNCDLKICDMGMAKLITSKVNNDGDLTDFVITPWYRPPEMVMRYGIEKYDSKVDMFSAGCVLAEMLRQKPLFQSKGEEEQVLKMI